MRDFGTFLPPERTLMGPGPSDVHPRVLNAMARSTVGHLDPLFIELMDDTKQLLQYAFKTTNALTMPVSAPGSAGMEACFANLVEVGDTVLVCVNGVFGTRMVENVKRMGATPVVVEDSWGEQTSLQKVEDALKQHPNIKVVAFVHAETSTGVRNDAKTLCELARQYDCLTIVDAVTSLGGIEVDVDGWQVDAIYSGSQKCLSCVPGLSPVSFSDKAVEVIKSRNTPVQSWFLDMNLIVGYWGQGGKRAYHHTAPVNSIYALYESLVMLKEEGLVQGENGLRVIMMCELPSNALLADKFLDIFDGFSIGSNDLTQLTLGLDRDSGLIAHLFEERDEAVKALLSMAIRAAKARGKYVGICGQGPSDHEDFAAWLVKEGIDSVSLNPDTVVETWLYLAENHG